MSNINTEEKRRFFRDFKYEVLTEKPENKGLISDFVSKKANNSLEDYIKNENKAWAEDSDGETKVYLIKDKTDKVALFFSIKCGLLVGEDTDERLSSEDQGFVDALVEAKREKDEEAIKNYYEYGFKIYGEKVDKLFERAFRRLNTEMESMEIGQTENTMNVPECISAIELRHLCRNERYSVPEEIGVPLGFGLFWEKIVSIIIEIAKRIGCKYMYLFAADNTEPKDSELKKLIGYYKNALKFYECGEGMKFVKPEYDNYCYGLVQEISKLEENREAVWQEFSDV